MAFDFFLLIRRGEDFPVYRDRIWTKSRTQVHVSSGVYLCLWLHSSSKAEDLYARSWLVELILCFVLVIFVSFLRMTACACIYRWEFVD